MKKTMLLVPLAFYYLAVMHNHLQRKQSMPQRLSNVAKVNTPIHCLLIWKNILTRWRYLAKKGVITLMQRQNLSKLVSHCHKLKTS